MSSLFIAMSRSWLIPDHDSCMINTRLASGTLPTFKEAEACLGPNNPNSASTALLEVPQTSVTCRRSKPHTPPSVLAFSDVGNKSVSTLRLSETASRPGSGSHATRYARKVRPLIRLPDLTNEMSECAKELVSEEEQLLVSMATRESLQTKRGRKQFLYSKIQNEQSEESLVCLIIAFERSTMMSLKTHQMRRK